jgi:hypothetical protein
MSCVIAGCFQGFRGSGEDQSLEPAQQLRTASQCRIEARLRALVQRLFPLPLLLGDARGFFRALPFSFLAPLFFRPQVRQPLLVASLATGLPFETSQFPRV